MRPRHLSRPGPGLVLALAVVALLALGACGGDDDSASTTRADTGQVTTTTASTSAGGTTSTDEDAFIAQVAAQMGSTEMAGTDPAVTECYATEIVRGVGFDQIQAAGITPEQLVNASSFGELNLTVDDPDALQAGVAGCGDLVAVVLGSREVTPDQEVCVRAAVSNDIMAEVLVDTLIDREPSPEAQAASQQSQACFD